MTPDHQIYAASLLKYYHHGSLSSFGRVCTLTGLSRSEDHPFRLANLLLASELVGLVDIRYASGERSWWAAFDGDIDIRGAHSKSVGTTADWFTRHIEKCRPLVVDKQGNILALGMDLSPDTPRAGGCDFGTQFLSRMPTLRDVEQLLVREEAYGSFERDHRVQMQAFLLDARQWTPIQKEAISERALIRWRTAYSGWQYELVARDLGLRFLIAEPEWVFPLAANILDWALGNFLRATSAGVQLHRAFRLPTILLRYLFANSKTAVVSGVVHFEDVTDAATEMLVAYLSAGRRRK